MFRQVRSDQVVHIRRSRSSKRSLIRCTSQRHHLLLIVLEKHININGALLIHLILYEVLTIIVVSNLTGDHFTLNCFNSHLKVVTAGLAVLSFIIPRLDNKFDWLLTSLLF